MYQRYSAAIRSACLGAAVLTLVVAATAAPKPTAQQGGSASATTQKLGEISIKHFSTMTLIQGVPGAPSSAVAKNQFTADLQGPNLQITSARYDMAAPHIVLTIKNKLVSTSTATGGVRVDVRNPDAGVHTTVTCNTAIYTGASVGNRGRINFKGNVHSNTTSPQLAVPLVSDSETGYIDFSDPNSTRFVATNGSATVTPIEPDPRSKK